jgi:taurine--2-oxoglutarate transaminase
MIPRSSQQIKELTAKHIFGTWRFKRGWPPLHIVDANDSHFIDAAGNRYLDFSSQLMCVTLRHKNEAVIKAIERQARQLAYISPGYTTDVRADVAELLLEVLPPGLEKFFFTTSGTDANEAAFKIGRMVTGRSKIISRYRSYHGSTLGSIAATGDPRGGQQSLRRGAAS